MAYSVVGKSLPFIDGIKKATGQAQYPNDLWLPGMHFAAILRSPLPHAWILDIDVSRAERLPGVSAVVTSQDLPDERQGLGLKDQPIFARDKVRYIGESVAGVVAVDEETALAALGLIAVEYEPLAPVFDPREAMRPGAPIIHEDLPNYQVDYERTEESMRGNIAYHGSIQQGDLQAGFSASDEIFEDTFSTQKVHQGYLEPHCCLAAFDDQGRVTVWTTTQRPHSNQVIISNLLRLPMSKIRVKGCFVGGAFGGKNRTLIEPLCVALAQKARKPVKLTFTREEEFCSATSRHPCIVEIKTGVKRDGTLLARKVRLIYDSGAYCMVPNAIWLGALHSRGPYRIPNFRVDTYSVYTNKSMSAAFRGFGSPQVTFAFESQMDAIAEKLDIDPVELRLRNAMESGDRLATGQEVPSVRLKDTLRAAARMAQGRSGTKGLAACGFVCGGFVTSSFVRVNEDGTALVATGAMDMGQGLRTAMAQIVAEELGLLPEDVTVISGDTDATPFDIGIFGDRGTNTAGTAARMAAEEARAELLRRAAFALEANVSDLEASQRKVFVKGSPEKALSIVDLLRGKGYMKGGPILGKASFLPEVRFSPPGVARGAVTPFFRTMSFNTQLAEMQVDQETGRIKLARLITSHDCGQALNPMAVEGQLEGGLATGLGYGLSEEILYDEGQVLTTGFLDYHMPTAADLPLLETHIVDGDDPTGPFGAKGVGNAPLVPTAPAIANGLYKATAVRINDLPLTPHKVLKALEERAKRP